MIALERLENALRSTRPGHNLRALVRELANEGHAKSAIYEALERLLAHLRAQERTPPSDEEVVLDVMDALSGWCHPDAELLPEQKPL
jgi:hypothetical protein